MFCIVVVMPLILAGGGGVDVDKSVSSGLQSRHCLKKKKKLKSKKQML